jgi:hypothetical protein
MLIEDNKWQLAEASLLFKAIHDLINPCHRGLAYGDGHIQGAGALGQVVSIAGNDLFAVNTDPTAPSFGLLIKDYASGEMPGIYCMGGVYETDTLREGKRKKDKCRMGNLPRETQPSFCPLSFAFCIRRSRVLSGGNDDRGDDAHNFIRFLNDRIHFLGVLEAGLSN